MTYSAGRKTLRLPFLACLLLCLLSASRSFAQPSVTAFSPTVATRNDMVTINGTGFETVSAVSMGGVAAQRVWVESDTKLFAWPGKGRTTNNLIIVTNEEGADTVAGFTLHELPAADSIRPQAAHVGDTITIYGTGFTGVNAIHTGFPVISIPAFQVLNDSVIKALIGYGNNGFVLLSSAYGTDSTQNAYFTLLPEVRSFYPESGGPGTSVLIKGVFKTIDGSGSQVESVSFGDVPAGFNLLNDSTLTAVVGDGATGKVTVKLYDKEAVASAADFRFVRPASPTLISFNPAYGYENDSVTVKGAGFTGATSADIGGVPVKYLHVYNDSTVGFHAGAGVTGPIKIVTKWGSDTTRTRFTFLPNLSRVKAFTPASAKKGDVVTISGSDLDNVRAVYFGGVAADSFKILSRDMLKAWVGKGNSGFVRLVSAAGEDSLAGFSFIIPAPEITSYAPTQIKYTDSLYIHGQNLSSVTNVLIGGVAAASFRKIADSVIVAVLGRSRLSARPSIVLVSPAGNDTATGLQYLRPPFIDFLNSWEASINETIQINGSNFTGVTEVHLGSARALSFTVQSDNIIRAVVGSGTNGLVKVVNAYGFDTSIYPFIYVSPQPVIRNFYPQTAQEGDSIWISGARFRDTAFVTFGGVPAARIKVVSDSLILAYVGKGASGNIEVTTSYGAGLLGGFTFMGSASRPVINSFTPTSGYYDDSVVIRGSGFTGATAASIGGVPGEYLYVYNDSTAGFHVGEGATGTVSIVTPQGTDTSATVFTYLPGLPHLSGFLPAAAKKGEMVSIYGSRLQDVKAVYFGGVAADSFRVIYSRIEAWPGVGASGFVKVVSEAGIDSMAGFTYTGFKPDILSVTPAAGRGGDTVRIAGKYFTGTTSVQIGREPATILSTTDTSITVRIANNASNDASNTSAYIIVTTASGKDTAGFVIYFRPVVSAVTPAAAAKGETVVIKGIYLSNATAVRFGGVPAKSFTVVSSVQINAVVDTGATGKITVVTPWGIDSSASFIYQTAPVITRFSPGTARAGDTINIYGKRFIEITNVWMGSDNGTGFRVVNDTLIKKVVLSAASNGFIIVNGRYGADTSDTQFVFSDVKPVITSFSPASGYTGDTVVVKGNGFTGATKVTLNNVAVASFTVNSDSAMWFRVGQNTTGKIAVTTAAGTGTSAGSFSFITPTPRVTSFTPTSARKGDAVLIYGTGFRGVTGVSFGAVAADSFRIVSDMAVKAWIGNGRSGFVRVMAGGNADSLGGFTWLPTDTVPVPGAPVITRFSPGTARAGDTINIYGKQFIEITNVWMGSDNGTGFRVVNDTLIKKVVLSAASNGYIMVYGRYGTDTSDIRFVFEDEKPEITSFAPAAASPGKTVVIKGKRLKGAIAVRLGDALASSFTVVADSIINAVVPNDANNNTGTIVVTTAAGKDTAYGFTVLPPAPLVTSLSPSAATLGETVIIRGTGLAGASGVRFGGRPAASFVVVSATQINAVVDSGATGKVTVVTPNGVDTSASFTYVQPAPTMRSFAPQSARTGDTVYIYGTRLNTTSSVKFGSLEAQRYQVLNDTVVRAVVGFGASGNVMITTRFGTAQLSGFLYPGLPPAVYDFTPKSGAKGDVIKIRGTHFSQATQVRLGNYAPASFVVESDSIISATVGAGDTSIIDQPVSVVTPGGTAAANGFTYINAGTFNLSLLNVLPGKERVHISWRTNGEKYTASFRLIWTRGSETVYDIGIPAAGFSDTAITYSFIFPITQSGKNLLQLRTYDRMGNETLADTASFMVDGEAFARIGSYPNPAVSSTTVQHPATAGSAAIMMFNMNGSLVLTQNVKPGDVQTVIHFNTLPKGMYKLVWTNGGTSKSTTIMLQ